MADILGLNGFPTNLVPQTCTIAINASKSEYIATQGWALCGIIMPSAWTAADIGYEGCYTGRLNDMLPVYTGGGVPSTTVATASVFIAFPSQDAIFIPYLRITSVATGGGSVTPVTQAAAATITLIFRKLFS